ncbi:hypothetical protein BJ912DRAFT_1045124 [Pholiota molesta]|nr:hypothetical protein BJ912DRAFT_1045124 [Pholiota molesta]
MDGKIRIGVAVNICVNESRRRDRGDTTINSLQIKTEKEINGGYHGCDSYMWANREFYMFGDSAQEVLTLSFAILGAAWYFVRYSFELKRGRRSACFQEGESLEMRGLANSGDNLNGVMSSSITATSRRYH